MHINTYFLLLLAKIYIYRSYCKRVKPRRYAQQLHNLVLSIDKVIN